MISTRSKCLLFIHFVLIFVIIDIVQSDTLVIIKQGTLRGVKRHDRKGGSFYAFRSIPYAEPPLGDLRFKSPIPHTGWEGIRNTTEDVPICFQKPNVGQEDCLYLNVFTKEISSDNRKPVIVFFHGGAFTQGDAQEVYYNPEFLMTEDIVLVTAAYRLGVLGFLSLGMDSDSPLLANAGMKDQVLVLEWVKKNIHAFGGDPNSTTISGESAGGCSVHLHIFSPLSRGLFDKAIVESGSIFNSWCIGKPGSGEAIANQLNLTTSNPDEILVELQNIPVQNLIDAQLSLPEKFGVYEQVYTSPIIEGDIPQAFLPEDPKGLLKTQKYNHVPILIGYNDKEGMLVEVLNKINGEYMYLYDLRYLVPHDLNITDDSKLINLVHKLQDFYFNGRIPVPDEDALILMDVVTDTWFAHGIRNGVAKHVENQDKVFYYKFSADTKLNYFKQYHPVTALYKGASHVDELGYLFKNIFTPVIVSDSIEDRMIFNIVKLWTNFAIFGNPSTETIPWFQVNTVKELNHLHIQNDDFRNKIENSDERRFLFWDCIYKQYSNDTC